MNGYLSSKLEARSTSQEDEFGVFARELVKKGELLTIWVGDVVTLNQLLRIPEELRHLSVQIEEEFYLAPQVANDLDYFNHSCTPNAGVVGQITLVALRDILPNEEVCYDYATTDGSRYDEFECSCGSTDCRRRVTGEDWKRPELWDRYEGYFSPYLQRRIAALKKESQPERKVAMG